MQVNDIMTQYVESDFFQCVDSCLPEPCGSAVRHERYWLGEATTKAAGAAKTDRACLDADFDCPYRASRPCKPGRRKPHARNGMLTLDAGEARTVSLLIKETVEAWRSRYLPAACRETKPLSHLNGGDGVCI